MWSNPQFPEDLVTFTGEILNGKIHFLCSAPAKEFRRKIHRNILKYLDPTSEPLIGRICDKKIWFEENERKMLCFQQDYRSRSKLSHGILS